MRNGLAAPLLCLLLAGLSAGCLENGAHTASVEECIAGADPNGTYFYGTVHDTKGHALPGAVVTASRSGDTRMAQVDGRGCYLMSVEGQVSYTLQAQRDGYRSRTTQGAYVQQGDAKVFTFGLEQA